MVAAAEEMAEEDKAMKEKVEARNKLENYVYSVRNSTFVDICLSVLLMLIRACL